MDIPRIGEYLPKIMRWAIPVFLTVWMAGCVHRTTVSSEPLGIVNRQGIRQKIAKVFRNHPAQIKSPSLDEAYRQTFQKQIKGPAEALGDTPAVKSLNMRLKLDPDDVAARLDLAKIYEQYGLRQQALDEYREGFESSIRAQSGAGKDDTSANLRQMQTAAEGFGRCARALGRGPEAVPLLATLFKKFPSAGVANELGILYDEAGDLASGELAFRQAIAREPRSDVFHTNLGYNLLLQKKTEAAEAEFRRAINLSPKSATAHNDLGELLARRGDVDAAFQQFRLASSDAATAHNNLAVVLMETGDYIRSREELVKALSARYYFSAPMENYKLVQQLLRERDQMAAGAVKLPLNSINVPPSLALALQPTIPLAQDRRASEMDGAVEPKVSEERK